MLSKSFKYLRLPKFRFWGNCWGIWVPNRSRTSGVSYRIILRFSCGHRWIQRCCWIARLKLIHRSDFRVIWAYFTCEGSCSPNFSLISLKNSINIFIYNLIFKSIIYSKIFKSWNQVVLYKFSPSVGTRIVFN